MSGASYFPNIIGGFVGPSCSKKACRRHPQFSASRKHVFAPSLRFRPFFSGRRCLQKAPLCETYEKPQENQCFWPLSGRHGVLSGASLGVVGTARGRPRGSQRGAWRLHLRLEWALGGFWGHLGPIFVPFRFLLVHFSSFLCSFPLVSRALVSPCTYQRINRKFLS